MKHRVLKEISCYEKGHASFAVHLMRELLIKSFMISVTRLASNKAPQFLNNKFLPYHNLKPPTLTTYVYSPDDLLHIIKINNLFPLTAYLTPTNYYSGLSTSTYLSKKLICICNSVIQVTHSIESE